MYFELQLSQDVFTRIVRNRMKAVPICVDRELRDNNLLLVVDRVVIGENTSIQREKKIKSASGQEVVEDSSSQIVWIFSPTNYSYITVPFLQVRQDVAIYLVKSADLNANGPNPTPEFQAVVINLVYNVHLGTAKPGSQGGGPLTLSYTLAYVEFGLLYPLFSENQRREITQLMADVQLPSMTVDLGQLTAVMERPVTAINAGIACDPGGTFVALRADFDVYASPVAINRAFFEAGPNNVLAGKCWAMLLDANLLTQDAKRKADDMLKAAPKVSLESGPSGGWDAGGAAVNISAGVELVDACVDIDMDVDVDIRATFSVSRSTHCERTTTSPESLRTPARSSCALSPVGSCGHSWGRQCSRTKISMKD